MPFTLENETYLAPESEMQFAAYGTDFDRFMTEEDYLAIGVNPVDPTRAKPGSDDKVLMLAARYASGLPLWHDDDRYDHGPEEMHASN